MLKVQLEKEKAAYWNQQGARPTGESSIAPVRWWQWVVGILSIVIAIVAVLRGPMLVTELTNLRSRWTAAKAQVMIDEGRHEAAVASMLNAFERTPDEPEVVRTLAVAAAQKHPEEAKYLFERLDRLRAATPEDHTHLAAVLARLNDKTGASVLFANASKARTRDFSYWLARGDFSASEGLDQQARAEYETALQLSPNDPLAAVGLGKLLCSSAHPATVSAGVDMLLTELQQSLVKREYKRRDAAFDVLAHQRIKPSEQRRRLADIIEAMPVKTLAQSVLGQVMCYPLELDDALRLTRAEVIRSVIYTRHAQSLEAKQDAIDILQAQGEHRIVVEWLPSGGRDMGARLYAMRIDSLMALERWEDAEKMAANPRSPISSSTRNLLLALVGLRQSNGKSPDAETNLAAAMTAATDDGRQSTFLAIGRVALEYGYDKIAVAAFGTAMEFRFGQYLPLDEYVLAARRARVPAADVLHAMALREHVDRWNLDLQKHACYLRLLLATDIENTADIMRRLGLILPDDPYVTFLSALAAFRSGDYSGAADKLIPLPDHRWHQGEVAVMFAVFTAAGKFDQAEKLLKQLDGKNMFAEESALLNAPRALTQLIVGPSVRSRDLGGLRYLDDKH